MGSSTALEGLSVPDAAGAAGGSSLRESNFFCFILFLCLSAAAAG